MSPDVTVPSNATNVTIGQDGTVSATVKGSGSRNLGQLQLVSFINPGGPGEHGAQPAAGHGCLRPRLAPGTPGNEGLGTLSQGYLEASNVSVVEEMVKMIHGPARLRGERQGHPDVRRDAGHGGPDAPLMAGSEGLPSGRARGTGTVRATPPRGRAGGPRSRAFLASLLRTQLLILLLLLMAVVVVVVMVVVLVVVPAGVAAREQSPLPVPPARSPGPASGVIRGDRIVEAARASARVTLDAGLRDAGAGARWELAFPVSDVAVSPGASSLKGVLVTAVTVPSRSVFCTVEVRVAGVLVRKVGVKWRLVTGSAPVTRASPSRHATGGGAHRLLSGGAVALLRPVLPPACWCGVAPPWWCGPR